MIVRPFSPAVRMAASRPRRSVEAGGVFAAAEHVTRLFGAGALLRDQRLDVEAHLGQVGQQRVDRAHFVQLDDVQPLRRAGVAVGFFLAGGVPGTVGAAGGWRACRGAAVEPTISSSPVSSSCCATNGIELFARGEPMLVRAEEHVIDRQLAA